MKLSTTSYMMMVTMTTLLISTSVLCCTQKLVIDADGGADDAAAIILALTAWTNKDSKFEVVAITCVNGNTDEPTAEINVLKAVTVAKAPNVQIYGGAKQPLIEKSTTDYYFGKDGLGDFLFNKPITAKVNRSTHASVALIELAKLYPRQLNVLCLGPLTNIALAAALDPTFMNNVKRFYIMGGSVSGIGNKSPGVEFNFSIDPESNFIVLNHSRYDAIHEPNQLYPWETVLNSAIKKTWRIDKLGSIDSDIVQFLNKAESKSLKDSSRFWMSADLQATAVMIWPHLSKQSVVTNVTPVTDGMGRGTILVDYTQRSGKPKNCEIVQQIDGKEFQKKLQRHFS